MQRDTLLKTERLWELLGHLFLLGFILFCILCYKERLLNCDAAYYTYHILNHEDFFTKHDRWINFITQYPALLAIEMEWSLQTVMRIYSATFGVLYYLFFLLITYGFKNRAGGIYLILALVLTMRYKHYAGHTEITVAIAEAAMFYSLITSEFSKRGFKKMLYWGIILVMLGLMAVTHPVIVLPLLMVLGFELIAKNQWLNREMWWIIGLTVVVFGIKFLWVQEDQYESGKMDKLLAFNKVLFNPGEFYVFDVVGDYLWKEYIPALLAFFTSLGWLVRKKMKWSALYLLLCTLALFAMILTIHSYLRDDVYVMIDGYLGMLGLIWGVPLYFIMKSEGLLFRHGWIIPVLIVISSAMILSKVPFYQKRLDHYREIIAENEPHRKLIIKKEDFDGGVMWYPFESAMESLMLSCIEGQCATIYVNYAGRSLHELSEEADSYHAFKTTAPVSFLNEQYFNLPMKKYHVIDSVPWR